MPSPSSSKNNILKSDNENVCIDMMRIFLAIVVVESPLFYFYFTLHIVRQKKSMQNISSPVLIDDNDLEIYNVSCKLPFFLYSK